MRVLLLALFFAAPLSAQRELHRWDTDQWEHMAAGAAVALVIRGPWVVPQYRDAVWKRGTWQLGLSLFYEFITDKTARGYNPHGLDKTDTALDLGADMAGWLIVEGVSALIKKIGASHARTTRL